MAISHLVKELEINYEETFAERTRLLNFSNNKAKEDELEKGIERVKKDPEKLATDDKETSGILGALSVAIGIVVKLVKKMISFIIDKIKSIAKYAKMLRDLGKAMWNSCWKGSLKKTAKRTKNISSKLKSFKGRGAIIAGIAAVVSGLVYSIITNKKPEEEKQEKEEQSSPSPEAGGGASGGAGASGDFSLTPAASPLAAAPAPAAVPTPAASAPAAPAPPAPAAQTPAVSKAPAASAVASSASKSDPKPESTSTPEAVSATPAPKAGEPVEGEDPKTQSEKQIKGSGIKVRPTGDVWQGGPLSKTAVGVALAIQDQVKGFLYYTGLNDAYHKRERPNSQHAVGQGLDFVLDHMPSVKESQAIKEQIKLIAGVNPGQVMNEYYDPPQGNKAAYTTGPHMHVGVMNSASGLASPSKKIEKTIIATVETNKTQNNIYRKAV